MRAFLLDAGIAEPCLPQAILVAHELAANAIEHGAPRAEEIDVEITVDEEDVYLSVRSDPAEANRVTANAPDADAERGRGLQIVGAVAEWWVKQDGRGQIVTARLAR
jgi:two-component sensor histidine kinase